MIALALKDQIVPLASKRERSRGRKKKKKKEASESDLGLDGLYHGVVSRRLLAVSVCE